MIYDEIVINKTGFLPYHKILPPSAVSSSGQGGSTAASLQTPLIGLAYWTIHGATSPKTVRISGLQL